MNRAERRKAGITAKPRTYVLTDAELEKLRSEHSDADEAIEFLSRYIERKGYQAKSHYLTIKKWVFDAVKERRSKQLNTSQAQGSFDTEEFFNLALRKSVNAEASA